MPPEPMDVRGDPCGSGGEGRPLPSDPSSAPPTGGHPAVERWWQWLAIGAFMAALWAPVVQMNLHLIPEPAATENRTPPTRPTLTPDTWQVWPAGVQTWFDGTFGFRQTLVTAFNLVSVLGLHTSTSELVLLGHDGWLYYTVNGSIDDHRGLLPLPTGELQAIQAGLLAQQTQVTQRGATFLFVVCPDKHSVHPEHLPPELTRTGGPTRLEQVLSSAPPGLHLLDLRGQLLAAAIGHPVYHRTDSHWNDYGALVGYLGILEALRAQRPEVRSFAREDFVVHAEVHRGGGDLAVNMLALPPVLDEETVRVALPAATDAIRAANAPLRVLVYHDSFWLALKPYFEATFPNLTAVPSGYTFDTTELARARPDVVLQITVERNLTEVARLPITPP